MTTILYKRITSLFLLLALATSSCDDFFDVNESPNSLTEVPPATLLPPIISTLGYYAYGNFSLYTGSIMQYYAGHRGQPLQYAQLDFRASDTDNSWSAIYSGVLEDAAALQQQATVTEQPAYVGIAQILKANSYLLLTDIYGDIPFSQANNIDEFITTEYDAQEAVYNGIIEMLNNGIENVQADDASYVGDEDLIYEGDMDKWVRYANTLKLRALNHLSLRQPNAAQEFLSTNPLLMESNADNALVPFFDDVNQYNPRYQFDNVSGREDAAVSETFVNMLTALNDPRFLYYFEPIRNGDLEGTVAGNYPGDTQDDSGRERFSRVGLSLAGPDAPAVLASYAETQFIIAEVMQRAGNAAAAQEAYENAVTASLNYHSAVAGGATYPGTGVEIPEISEDDIATYLAQQTVSYSAAANKLERIMEQKYIALYTMPYEAWVDYRRVGDANYPDLVNPLNNRTQNRIPLRLPYPQLEIDLNGVNLQNGPGIPVPNETLVTQSLWWDVQ
ncbi:SusD/RagB family nutrient-binding outer membrane lipoprotein [Cesiribacter sp. SM1]|uniref:SusD/RagB family nutrient-binding outer membrane lipoprotein n=1 Tax=Cesiribacter sp. SM1 TaxID=2861196 RepID=UPI001CD608C5|nr:SusD/RagB family nutrient-binding outer membrane lipoprotein [Cesiribacter sp. SM1]